MDSADWFWTVVVSASIMALPVVGPALPREQKQDTFDEWHFLPPLQNYAPAGLPDFDQRQDAWKAGGIWKLHSTWSFCGPTCLADALWWFDSRHEDSLGFPGDGVDAYSLVPNFNAPGTPNPGPYPDDHTKNNVNDPLTSWNNGIGATELIETLARYCNTNFCSSPLLRLVWMGTTPWQLQRGAAHWLADSGKTDRYLLESYRSPSFPLVSNAVCNDSVVILFLLLSTKDGVPVPTRSHYVAVAGVDPTGAVALCDPICNKDNPGPSPEEHNDAAVVSYDYYPINRTAPFPVASWWIENMYDTLGGIPCYALIMSERAR